MKIIVPVAGLGKRLKPLTDVTPKALLPVAGKPVLGHILDSVVDLEPSEVLLVVGHLADQIEEYVRSNYDFPATFIVQDELLGLGYAIHLALQVDSDEPVLVILGDTITNCHLPDLIAAGSNVLGLKSVDDPRRFGVAEIVDGKIVGLTEKPVQPRSDKALVGLYFISDATLLKSQLERIVDENLLVSDEIQLTSALEMMIGRGVPFVPWEIDQWLDCGKPETMLQTNRRLLEAKSVTPNLTDSRIVPPVSIQAGVVVTDSEIKDSIICEQARITDCKLDASIIGCRVQLSGRQGSQILADRSAGE